MNLTWFEFSYTRRNNRKLRDVTASLVGWQRNMSSSNSRALFQIKWETLALRSSTRHRNKVKPPTEANSSPLQNKTSPLGFSVHNEPFSCDSVQSPTYDCHTLNSYNICLCGTTESIQRVDGVTMETFCFVTFFLLRSPQDYRHNGRQCYGCHSAPTVLNEPPAELHVLFIGASTRVFFAVWHLCKHPESQGLEKGKNGFKSGKTTHFLLFFSVSRSEK